MEDDKQYLEVGFKFEDEGQITPRIQKTLQQVSSRVKLNLDLGLDSLEIDSLINKLGRVDKKTFTLFNDGTEKTITDVNIGLAQTIKLQEQVSKNGGISQKYTITDNSAQATKSLYNELIKLQETEFKIKTQMLSADGEQLKVLQQQLFLTNTLQNSLGKSINSNSLTNSELNNKLVKERLNLNNELMKSQARVTESVELQVKKTIEEEKATQRLIEVKKKNLNLKIDSLQGKYGNNKGAIDELERLRTAINKVNGSDLKQVRYEFQMFETDIKSITNKAQSQLSNITKTDNKSMMDNLKANVSSLATYALGGSFVYSTINTFREAVNYTIEMNSAMTNLKKVTDETDATYNKFVGTMHTMSMELGTQANLMTEAVTSWAKTGKTLEESTNLAQNTMVLKNVGDISSVSEAQKMMIAPLKAFNIQAKDSIKLIDQYNNVSNNMAVTTDDLGQALSRSASSMAVAGNSLEQTIAMISSAQASTQLGGDVIGQALKTMSLRLATFKDDETGEIIPKMKEQLQELAGVDITDVNGQLKSTYDIYMEIGKVFNTLDKNSQLQIGEILGGKRQANIVSAILSDIEQLQRAYDLAGNSQGSAMKEFAKYQDSIQYSIDRLKESLNGFYLALTDDNGMKSFINILTGLIEGVTKTTNAFGTIPTVLGSITLAFTLFNTKARENIALFTNGIPFINKFNTSLNDTVRRLNLNIEATKRDIALRKEFILYTQKQGQSTIGLNIELLKQQGRLMASTVAMISAKVATIALQTAMSMGLSLAITVATSAITKLGSELMGTGSTMDDCSSQAKILADSLNGINAEKELVGKYGSLMKQLEDTNLSEEKRKELNKQVEEVKGRLASSENDYAWILNDENLTLDEQLSKMQQMYELNLKNKAMALDDEMYSQGKAKRIKDSLENDIKQYEELKKAISNSDPDGNTSYQGHATTAETLKRILGEVTERIKDNSLELDRYNGNVKLMEKANIDTGRSVLGLRENTKSLVDEINNSTDAIKSNTVAKQENKNVDSNTEVASLEDSTKAYAKSIEEISKLYGYIEDINKAQAMTPELVAKLANEYPQLGTKISDSASTLEYLNSLIKEQENIQNEAYQNMIAMDNDWYSARLQNGDEMQQAFNQFASQFVDVNSESYTFDSNNFNNLNEAKVGMINQLARPMAELIAGLVGGNADGYEVDLRNTKDWATLKAKILQKLDEQITKIESRLADHVENIKKVDSARESEGN